MCGIFGADFRRSNLTERQKGIILSTLAKSNEKRGHDSWGIFDVEKNSVDKDVGPITNAISKVCEFNFGFGHTRHGTHGNNSVPNAHPFTFGTITLAHNGIIFNHDELNLKYNRDCQVDSMHIGLNISQNLGLDDLRGYGSIEWFDNNMSDTIRLCRLEGGELAIAAIMSADKTVGVVWSSSKAHLKDALDFAGVKFQEFNIETGKVYNVQDGNLFESDQKLALATRIGAEMGITWQQGRQVVRPYSSGYDFSDNNSHYTSTPSNWRDNRRLLREGPETTSAGLSAGDVWAGENLAQGKEQEILQYWQAEERFRVRAENSVSHILGDDAISDEKLNSLMKNDESFERFVLANESSGEVSEDEIDIPTGLLGKLENPLAVYRGEDIEFVDEFGGWVCFENGRWMIVDDNQDEMYTF